ncbi:Plasma membrane proteolipid 3 [Folsomia candida]|uniref:Plasma membrane proteolipid 3 n=1 Tax=Folsomia candida TaxID=158441 RepID=A0A226CX66_FOLCA|nr:Plasma membrane proteolipid 3 [Folsomia candida]
MPKVIEDQPVALNIANPEETEITSELRNEQSPKLIRGKISPYDLGVWLLIAIIFCPPLAVLYVTRSCTDTVFTLGATLLGWWPGMCVAYYKIVDVSENNQEGNEQMDSHWLSGKSERKRSKNEKNFAHLDKKNCHKEMSSRGISATKMSPEVNQGDKGKPFISNRNQGLGPKWARDHSAWTINDRKHILRTDEIKVKFFGAH